MCPQRKKVKSGEKTGRLLLMTDGKLHVTPKFHNLLSMTSHWWHLTLHLLITFMKFGQCNTLSHVCMLSRLAYRVKTRVFFSHCSEDIWLLSAWHSSPLLATPPPPIPPPPIWPFPLRNFSFSNDVFLGWWPTQRSVSLGSGEGKQAGTCIHWSQG